MSSENGLNNGEKRPNHKKNISLRMKLFLIFGGFLIFMIVSIVLIASIFMKEYYISVISKNMKKDAEIVEEQYNKSKKYFNMYLSECEKDWNVTIKIIDKNKNVKYSSERKRISQNELSDRVLENLEINENELEKKNKIVVKIYDKDRNYVLKLMCLSRLEDGKTIIILKTIKSIADSVTIANQFFFLMGSVFIIIGLFGIGIFSSNITKKFRKMNKVANEMANLNFETKVEVNSNDEIGQLGDSINILSDKLSQSINELKEDINRRKQLVRDMSHELKTPIASVKGYTEGLKYGVANSKEKMDQYCNIIVHECNRMDYIVKQMLQLSKMDSNSNLANMNKIQTEKFMNNIKIHFDGVIKEKNIEMSFYNMAPDVIYGDEMMLERAVFNYIDNAIRYCKNKITVTLRNTNYISECQDETKKMILKLQENQVNKDSNYLVISVYNDGKNINEETQNEIWEAFFKEDPSRKRDDNNNFGIGLSIVKSIAKSHGGEAYFINKKVGVNFELLIPQNINHTI